LFSALLLLIKRGQHSDTKSGISIRKTSLHLGGAPMSMENVRKIEMKSGKGDDAEIKSVFGAKKSEGKVSTLRVFIVAIRLSMAVNGILLTICTFHFPATYLRFRFQLGGWQVIRKPIQKFILGPVSARNSRPLSIWLCFWPVSVVLCRMEANE